MDLWSLILGILNTIGSLLNPNQNVPTTTSTTSTMMTTMPTMTTATTTTTLTSPLITRLESCPPGFVGSSCNIECGITYFRPSLSVRIVGGLLAAPYSWPAQALVQACYGDNFYLPEFNITTRQNVCNVCGGTLIDDIYVVTSAQCFLEKITFVFNGISYTRPAYSNSFYPTNASMFTVWLGAYDLKDLNNMADNRAVKLTVAKATKNENFDPVSFLNDIALLKLSQPVQLNKFIQPACLPTIPSPVYPVGRQQPGWIIGWGSTEDDSFSTKLQNGLVSIYDGQTSCSKYDFVTRTNWSNQICAGYLPGGVGPCRGDQGGPLYVYDLIGGKSKYILAGIISYANDCGKPGYPGVYTRISNYLDWIVRNK